MYVEPRYGKKLAKDYTVVILRNVGRLLDMLMRGQVQGPIQLDSRARRGYQLAHSPNLGG